jgi:hypothetical protein
VHLSFAQNPGVPVLDFPAFEFMSLNAAIKASTVREWLAE